MIVRRCESETSLSAVGAGHYESETESGRPYDGEYDRDRNIPLTCLVSRSLSIVFQVVAARQRQDLHTSNRRRSETGSRTHQNKLNAQDRRRSLSVDTGGR